MDKTQILEGNRVRLETLRGEPVAFRQLALMSGNGCSVIWTGADLDYYEELCSLEKRLADLETDRLCDDASVSLVSESACVQ